jgi:hypothetical protein
LVAVPYLFINHVTPSSIPSHISLQRKCHILGYVHSPSALLFFVKYEQHKNQAGHLVITATKQTIRIYSHIQSQDYRNLLTNTRHAF